MFGKILGKNNSKVAKTNNKLLEKISRMNLSDMRVYVNNNLENYEISEDGLCEVMKVLVSKDSKNKRFIENDAMDSKIKKAFDLVLIIAKNKRMNIDIVELIGTFIELYTDIITKYDRDNKQIYASKLKDAAKNSLATMQTMTDLNHKMKVLDT